MLSRGVIGALKLSFSSSLDNGVGEVQLSIKFERPCLPPRPASSSQARPRRRNDSAQQLTTPSRPNFRKRNSFSRLVDVSGNVNIMDANFVILALFALGLAGRCTTMVAL